MVFPAGIFIDRFGNRGTFVITYSILFKNIQLNVNTSFLIE